MTDIPEVNLTTFIEEFTDFAQGLGVYLLFNPQTNQLVSIHGLSPAKKELLLETLDLIIDEVLATYDSVDDENVDYALSRLNSYADFLTTFDVTKRDTTH